MRGRNYTRKDMDSWAESLIQLPKEIANLGATVSADKNHLDVLQQQLVELNEKQISPTHLLISRLIAKIELPTLSPQIQTLNSEAQQLTAQADALDVPISDTRQAIKPVKAEINQIERLLSLKEIQREIVQLGEDINELSQSGSREERDLAVARSALSSIEVALSSQSSQLTSLQLNKTSILTSLETMRHSVYEANPVTVQSGGVGVVTGTPVTVQSGGVSVVSTTPIYHHHDHQQHTAEFERQLREIESLIDNCNREIRQQRSQRDDTQSRISQIEGRIERHRRDSSNKQARKRRLESDCDSYSSNEQHQARNSTIEAFNRELRAKKSVLSSLEAKLNELVSEQKALNNSSSSRRYQIRQLKDREHECQELIKDFAPNLDKPLEQQREAQQILLCELDAEKLRREKEIQALRVKITADENQIYDIKRKLEKNQANQFLRSLKHTPQDLLDKLELDIYQAIKKFENEHPEEQSFRVRKYLAELQYKIPFLKSAPLSVKDEVALARDRYFLLYGLIWDMVHTTSYTDEIFKDKITQALYYHDIDYNDARSEYQALKLQYPKELIDLTIDDLVRIEKEAYLNSRNAFNALLARIRTTTIPELKRVKELGEQLFDDIQLKEKAAEKTHREFDNKYYTGLFNLASQLLTQPNEMNLHIAYRAHISHHPDETPSCGYKVGGIAMMFFGAVITAAAAIVAIFGFPIGTPLYVSLPVAGVGIAMILTGIGLFRHSLNKGLPGKLNEFVDECDKQKSQQMIDSTSESEALLSGPGSYNLTPSAPGLDV